MTDLILKPIKPCKVCGTSDRYASSRCKACQKLRVAKWQAANQDKCKENVKKYAAENKEKGRAQRMKYRAANPDKMRAHRLANADKTKARALVYYAKNIEKIKAYYLANKASANLRSLVYYTENSTRLNLLRAEQYKADPHKTRARNAAYQKANPLSKRAWRQNRRARAISAEGSFTKLDVKRLFNLQRGTCPACKADLSAGYHVDHIQALANGGSNLPSNLQLLCPSCNMSKSTKHSVDFMQQKGFLL